MDETSLQKLNDLFVDALERATKKLLSQADEEIEYQLFEEFDIGAHTFLEEKNLETLKVAGFIDEEIKNLSHELRRMSLELLDGKKPRNADTVKTDSDWHKVLELSDKIRDLKLKFDKGRRIEVV